jgi:hypothetical protein
MKNHHFTAPPSSAVRPGPPPHRPNVAACPATRCGRRRTTWRAARRATWRAGRNHGSTRRRRSGFLGFGMALEMGYDIKNIWNIHEKPMKILKNMDLMWSGWSQNLCHHWVTIISGTSLETALVSLWSNGAVECLGRQAGNQAGSISSSNIRTILHHVNCHIFRGCWIRGLPLKPSGSTK